MILSVRTLPDCLFVLSLLTPFGRKSARGEGAGQSGADISGPLTMLADYYARAPRTCTKGTSPPSVAVAAVVVQCAMEANTMSGIGPVQDENLEIGKPRPFVQATDAEMPGIDLDAKGVSGAGQLFGLRVQDDHHLDTGGQERHQGDIRNVDRIVLQDIVRRLEIQFAGQSQIDQSPPTTFWVAMRLCACVSGGACADEETPHFDLDGFPQGFGKEIR